MTALADIGWSDFFAAQIGASEAALAPGRVAFESHGIYQVMVEGGGLVQAELKGLLRKGARGREAFPVVGDWVLLERAGAVHGTLIRRLERLSSLARRELGRTEGGRSGGAVQILAVNVDLGLIATSLNEDLNERRLERYLGLVREAQVEPLILLTKTDLMEDQGLGLERAVRSALNNADCLRVCAPTGQGLPELAARLKGRTAVLLGSSGVGKSTLANALLGREAMATGEIREKDGRGRHTTAGRQLLALPGGGALIDSPGLRELGMLDEKGATASFDDIERLARACRFSDCGHSNEPGCAVKAAVAEGNLDEGRLEAYVKLTSEGRSAARHSARKKGR